jgi:hypothetical protein
MALKQNQLSSPVKQRLARMAAEMREILSGEVGHPQWGTSFAEIEADGMDIGLELARVTVEQAVASQAKEAPPEAWSVPDEQIQPAGRRRRVVQTQLGKVAWEQPRGYRKKARRAFSPSGQGTRDGSRQPALADVAAEGHGAGDASVVVP